MTTDRVISNHTRGNGRDGGAHVDAPIVDGLGRRPVFLQGKDAHDAGLAVLEAAGTGEALGDAGGLRV